MNPLPFFYFFSLTAVLSALLAVTLSKPTRALLALIMMIFSLSGIYLLLGAHFLAMANLIVYAGAVLVLFLFVIMLLGLAAREIPFRAGFHPLFLGASCFVAAAFFAIIFAAAAAVWLPHLGTADGSLKAVGRLLFSKYLLPFELATVLLLVSVFAAVALAKREEP